MQNVENEVFRLNGVVEKDLAGYPKGYYNDLNRSDDDVDSTVTDWAPTTGNDRESTR